MQESHLAILGAALAEPARARMVEALMGGRALSATDLALEGDVTPQTGSSHLAHLVAAGLLRYSHQGRHRFYELASAELADALELMVELGTSPQVGTTSDEGEAFKDARTCYDHLAGRLGVSIARSLQKRGRLRVRGADFDLTRSGAAFFGGLGVDVEAPLRTRRMFARQCLDRTERVAHLGGALGATLAAHCLRAGWVRRTPGSRALVVTTSGRRALARHFDIEWSSRNARA